MNEEALDVDDQLKTSTFVAPILTNSITSTIEIELFNSGASQHMSPYRHKFINFVPIQKRVLTVADGSTFEAIGKGDMHITMLNCQGDWKLDLAKLAGVLKSIYY